MHEWTIHRHRQYWEHNRTKTNKTQHITLQGRATRNTTKNLL